MNDAFGFCKHAPQTLLSDLPSSLLTRRSRLLYTPHITTLFLLPYASTYLGPSQRLPAGRQAASHSELCCFLLVGLTTTMTTAAQAGEGRHARRSSSAKAAAAKAAWLVVGPASFPACVVVVKREEMSMCSGWTRSTRRQNADCMMQEGSTESEANRSPSDVFAAFGQRPHLSRTHNTGTFTTCARGAMD